MHTPKHNTRLAAGLNASLSGVEWGDERAFRHETAMGAARESLLRVNRRVTSDQEEEEEEEGGLWTPQVCNALLAEAVRATDVKGAQQVMQRMLRANMLADQSTLHGLLEVYAERGEAGTALELLKSMEETGLVVPDALSVALVVEACVHSAAAASAAAAAEAKTKMGEEGGGTMQHPHLEAASALVEAAVGKGLCQESRELWEARVRLAAAIAAAAAASTSTPEEKGEEEDGLPPALEALLREMDAAGFPPSVSLVADVLLAFTAYRQPARATSLFSALRWHQQQHHHSKGAAAAGRGEGDTPPPLSLLLPPPTRALHRAMLASLCAPGTNKWPAALSLLRKMQSRALPHLAPWQLESTAPTRPCYTTVVEGAVRGGDMPAALSVLKTMEGHGILPSQRCLVQLIQGFAVTKDVASALGVWRELRLLYSQGQTSRRAFEAILSACVVDPMGVEPALGVLGDMARSGWSLERQYYLPFMVRSRWVAAIL